MLRVALSPDDFRELLEQLDHWDHPVAHRLRMVYSKYSIKRMQRLSTTLRGTSRRASLMSEAVL